MSSDSSIDLNLDGRRQLRLPHADHPEDGHTKDVYGIRLRGDHLVSVSADRTVRIWDLRTQRLLHPPLVGHTGSVIAVHFDADTIITGDTAGTIRVWPFSTGEAVKTIIGAHDENVLSLHFDDRYLVTGGKDKKVKLWTRCALDVDHGDVPDFAIKPADGDRYDEYSLLATFDGHIAAVNALKLRDNVIVSGSGDHTILLWSLQSGEILQKINIHQMGVVCLQYNVRFIVSGSSDKTARIYDVEQKVEVACLQGHTNIVRSIQALFDDNGEVRTVVTGGYDGDIRVWEPVQGSREWRTRQRFPMGGFQAHGEVQHGDGEAHDSGERIFSIALDEERFVCSGQGPIIRVWDLRSRRE